MKKIAGSLLVLLTAFLSLPGISAAGGYYDAVGNYTYDGRLPATYHGNYDSGYGGYGQPYGQNYNQGGYANQYYGQNYGQSYGQYPGYQNVGCGYSPCQTYQNNYQNTYQTNYTYQTYQPYYSMYYYTQYTPVQTYWYDPGMFSNISYGNYDYSYSYDYAYDW